MNTAYTFCLLISWLFFSPLPKADNDILVGRISIYLTGDKEEFYWRAEIDKTIYPNDCALLYDIMCLKGEICSEAELEYIKKILDAYYSKIPIETDTIIKRI